jgi:hypothetical protein
LDDYPFAVAAFGLAIGVVAAACLPRSHREDELLGETSDRLKEAVRDTVNKVTTAAEDSTDRKANRDPARTDEMGGKADEFAERSHAN